MNPVPCRPFAAVREFWCSHYDECLGRAVQEEWASFTCRECQAFNPIECDPGEMLADSVACRALVMAIFYPRFTRFVQRSTLGKVAHEVF